MSRQTETGNAGEAYVSGRLAREGYTILDHNWRVRGGEIDIVALDGECLVFVEVRVRTGEAFGRASDSVDARKLSKLFVAAERYLAAHEAHHHRVWRVDLVAVTLDGRGVVRGYEHHQNLTLE